MRDHHCIALPLFARLEVRVDAPLEIGETAQGRRCIIPITGGLVCGARLNGVVQNRGADYQLAAPGGLTTLEAHYVIETRDGALIYVVNRGIRRASPEITARLLRGEPVDPSEVYFWTTPQFETAAPQYQFLTQSLFAARGIRLPSKVLLELYELN